MRAVRISPILILTALLIVLIIAGCDLLAGPSPAQSARPGGANSIPNFSTQPLTGTIVTIYLPRLFPDGSLALAAAQRGIPPQDDQLADGLQALPGPYRRRTRGRL